MRSARLLLCLTLAGGCHLALGFDGLDYSGEPGTGGLGGAGASAAGTGGVATSSGFAGGAGEGGAGGVYVSECPDGKVEVPSDPPAGWQGFVSIVRGPNESALPGCGSAQTWHDGLQAADASCSCQCATPTVGDCTAQVQQWSTGCQNAQGTVTLTNNDCYLPDVSFALWNGAPAAGACGGTVQTSKPAASWTQHLRACPFDVTNIDPPGCTDAPPPPFEERLCIWRDGDHACPNTGDYHTDWTFYGSHDDGRGCEASCSCGPSGTVCTGTMTAFDNHSCTSNANNGSPGEGPPCKNFGAFSLRYSAQLGSGSCAPTSTPQPTGTAVESGPVTICCSQ